MENYPSNSHKSRQASGKETPKDAEMIPVDKKKVERVTTHEAHTKKPGVSNKLAKVFLPEDVTNVKDWIVWDILVPGAKNLLLDVINETLGGRRVNRSSFNGTVRTNYGGVRSNTVRAGQSRSIGFEFEDVTCDSREDAQAILRTLDDLMDQYNNVSVADLYSAAGISCSNYMYNNWGWTDISTARIVRDIDGWVLKFPKAISLK
jgi:hypothetical protein